MFCDVEPVRRFCFHSVSFCRTSAVHLDSGAMCIPNMQFFGRTIQNLPLNAKPESSLLFARTTSLPERHTKPSRMNNTKASYTFYSVRYWHSFKIKGTFFSVCFDIKVIKKINKLITTKTSIPFDFVFIEFSKSLPFPENSTCCSFFIHFEEVNSSLSYLV